MAENGSWFDHVIHWHEQCMVRKYTTKFIYWVDIHFCFFKYLFNFFFANNLASAKLDLFLLCFHIEFTSSPFFLSLSQPLIITISLIVTHSNTHSLTNSLTSAWMTGSPWHTPVPPIRRHVSRHTWSNKQNRSLPQYSYWQRNSSKNRK